MRRGTRCAGKKNAYPGDEIHAQVIRRFRKLVIARTVNCFLEERRPSRPTAIDYRGIDFGAARDCTDSRLLVTKLRPPSFRWSLIEP